MHGQTEIVCYLLMHAGDNKAFVDQHTKEKKTALIFASERGHYTIAKLLLDYEATATKGDRHGRHPLIHATMNGHLHVASLLLRHGVHPDLPDSSGNTSMHFACAYGWKEFLPYLLQAEANPN